MTNNFTEQIASILSGQLDIQKVSQEVIEIMLEDYPYSPYGHLVNYLKAKSENSSNTQELLHKLSAYCPDRAWLQEVLNTKLSDIELHETEETAIPSEAKAPNLDMAIFEFDFSHPTPEEDATPLQIETPVDESSNLESNIEDIVSNDTPSEQATETPIVEAATESELETVQESSSFVSWLTGIQGEPEVSTIVENTELSADQSRSTDVLLPKVEKTTRADKDLFGGIITETLAELLANQGQIEKAISMYTRLSLIFPNKTAFFAAKIEQLKSNIT